MPDTVTTIVLCWLAFVRPSWFCVNTVAAPGSAPPCGSTVPGSGAFSTVPPTSGVASTCAAAVAAAASASSGDPAQACHG